MTDLDSEDQEANLYRSGMESGVLRSIVALLEIVSPSDYHETFTWVRRVMHQLEAESEAKRAGGINIP